MKVRFSTLLIIVSLLQSCNMKETRTNHDDDLVVGREMVLNMYALSEAEKYDEAASLFGTPVTHDEAKNVFLKVKNHLGKLKSYTETSAKSKIEIENGIIKNGRFEFDYKVTYENGIAEESIILVMKGDELVITGYHPIVKI